MTPEVVSKLYPFSMFTVFKNAKKKYDTTWKTEGERGNHRFR